MQTKLIMCLSRSVHLDVELISGACTDHQLHQLHSFARFDPETIPQKIWRLIIEILFDLIFILTIQSGHNWHMSQQLRCSDMYKSMYDWVNAFHTTVAVFVHEIRDMGLIYVCRMVRWDDVATTNADAPD